MPASRTGTPRKLSDVSRLHGLGWRHRIGLREGVCTTYEWYLQEVGDDMRKSSGQPVRPVSSAIMLAKRLLAQGDDVTELTISATITT